MLQTDEIITLLLQNDTSCTGGSICDEKRPLPGESELGLSTMSRAQLQALAKKAGIKANHKVIIFWCDGVPHHVPVALVRLLLTRGLVWHRLPI